MMTDTGTVRVAGSAVALRPRSLRTSLLPRVLGIYIAAFAAGIQLLDIAVDRFALDDRVFTFAVMLAIIGIPFAGAGAVLLEAARAERRPPRRGTPPDGVTHVPPPNAIAATAGFDSLSGSTAELPRRLEIALSYVRIAQLQAETGDEEAAAAHRGRAASELRALIAQLEGLLNESAEREKKVRG